MAKWFKKGEKKPLDEKNKSQNSNPTLLDVKDANESINFPADTTEKSEQTENIENEIITNPVIDETDKSEQTETNTEVDPFAGDAKVEKSEVPEIVNETITSDTEKEEPKKPKTTKKVKKENTESITSESDVNEIPGEGNSTISDKTDEILASRPFTENTQSDTPADAPDSLPVSSTETTPGAPAETPAPIAATANETVIGTITETTDAPAAVESKLEEEVKSEITDTPAAEAAVEKPLTQDELEEKFVEKWWLSMNKPADVNHFQLAYTSGINMDKFSNLEANVGKFKFTRSYVGENWKITVVEK